MMKSINVAFYSPSYGASRSSRLDAKVVMVNPTPYYLHGYFKKNYPDYAQYVNWKTSLVINKTAKELLDFLVLHDIDVLCASLYVWNVQDILDIFDGIKEKYFDVTQKQLKIVFGGPSCNVLHDDWGKVCPYVDHFVVGQGEKAWASLALNFIGVTTLDNTATNIVHFASKTSKPTYQHEFIRGIHYSPYLESKDAVQQLIKEYEGYTLAWPYETQRGCPYHCSFCDWNGGQSNKTQKRKEVNFIDEIDFFAENKMYNLHISDANFGMWDVDVDIMERLVKHKLDGHPFGFQSFNMSKLINANYKKIMWMIVKYNFNTIWVKLSVQDIHKNVLDAIDRPGNWDAAKEFGLELYKEFAIERKLKIFVELIIGLPEQTVESWTETLDEIYSSGFIPRSYPFLILVNAPVKYNQEYRAKYGIKDDQVFEVIDTTIIGNTIKEIYDDKVANFIYPQVTSCNTFSERELVRMVMIDQLYRLLLSRLVWPAYGFIDVNWHHLKPILNKLITTEDFEYVLEQRYANFVQYRINAMDSAQGKIMVGGADMSSLVGRNYELIHQSFAETKIDDIAAAKFLEVWDQFKSTARWLDR